MITVHHLEKSRSHRILWLLEELKLEYELKIYKRNPETNLAPEELKKVHPLGKSPVVSVDDMVFAESGAIIENLVDQYGNGKLKPAEGSPDFLRYRYWMHAAEGSLMPVLLLKLIFTKTETAPPWFLRPITKAVSRKVHDSYINPTLKGMLDYMDSELGKSQWIAGEEFSAADVQMGYGVEAICSKSETVQNYPAIRKYFERLKAREAFQIAIEKGGPSLPL